ncbi:MAG TPA: PIG-L family deacetylase [Candidatus Limnocylindria bacterium]|nr:PIG-L family deacetylase [Candidatus Limnocylindria bacterium]
MSTTHRQCGRRYWSHAMAVVCLLVHPLTGDSRAAESPTGAAILQDLRSFREMGTVLHLAAHPDDENTQLITYLARGRGCRTGYLSITRGDGGQNEIGPEFDEKLGVARTQELMAARRLDGGRQFFTRAIDFGFSKTPEETLRFWDREQVLADVVRIIRTFRPDVIVTRFPVPPGSGGHGHHTASAMLAVEAFKVCGDAKAFPEQLTEGLKPWQPKRVLWNGGGRGRGGNAAGGPTVRVDIGGKDPVTDEPFGAIAGRSRAMHKTQGFGNFGGGGGGGGANVQTFTLLAGEPATNDLMDGVELTWNRITGGAEIGKLADEAIATFKSDDAAASVPVLLALRSKLAALASEPLVEDKRQQLDGLLKKCLGLSVETTVPTPEVAPGETVKLQHTAQMSSKVSVRWAAVRYPDLKREIATSIPLTANEATHVAAQTIPANTPPTQPYWLREEGASGIFRVDDKKLIGRPENSPAFPVEFVFEVGGQTLVVADEPVSTADSGKLRKLVVISPVALNFGSAVALFKPGSEKSLEVEVTAARSAVEGTLRLRAPSGWSVSPTGQSFKLSKAGDKAKLAFTVSTKQASSGNLIAVAEIGGVQFSNQRIEIRYDHIPVQVLQPPAKLKVAAFDVAIRGKTVGYLPGAGDDTVASLQQLGYAVTTLTGADLTEEKLRGLDAVVVGVRAFNERNDLAANLPGVFAYAENGGTVIVQYNRPTGLQTQKLGPYPLSIAGNAPQWRVTDETVPVAFLAPEHAALTTPNKIVPTDFDGWVQERGAYFPSSFDTEHYTPLLAMSDPGEKPLNSSVLVAKHGKGYFVYTGLAFFRQLPAGVPGAYRLFANLVSLGK